MYQNNYYDFIQSVYNNTSALTEIFFLILINTLQKNLTAHFMRTAHFINKNRKNF